MSRIASRKSQALTPKSDPVAFVISQNIRRRHLSVAQRVELAAQLLGEESKRAAARQELRAVGRHQKTGGAGGGRHRQHELEGGGNEFHADSSADVQPGDLTSLHA